MPGRDVIVIGASAGGVEALSALVRSLPSDLPAAVFVVLHVSPHGTSVLPSILNRAGVLPAAFPEGGEAIRYGRVYVAPPDRHLLVGRGHVRLVRGPRENGFRPAVDPLFRSAARSYRQRVVGVVLSGFLDDGTAGLRDIKARGGVAVVQDPDDAFAAGMPRSAVQNVDVDHVVPLPDVAPVLVRLAQESVEGDGVMADETEADAEVVRREIAQQENGQRPGTSSMFTCPDCGGVLWEFPREEMVSFRCHVGHVYSSESLLAEQSDVLESALWTAVRALEERASLVRDLGGRMERRGNVRAADRFKEQAREAERQADVVRRVLANGRFATTEDLSVVGAASRGQG